MKKRNKNKKLTAVITLGAAILITLITLICIRRKEYASGNMMIQVYEEKYTNKSIEEVEKELKQEIIGGIGELGYIERYISIQLEEKDNKAYTFKDFMLRRYKEYEYNISVSDTDIKKLIKEYNKGKQKSKNAYIKKGNEHFEIVEEVQGERISKKLIEALKSKNKGLRLEDFRIKPKITKEDLRSVCDKANRYVDWSIEYDRGYEAEIEIENIDIKGNKVIIKEGWIDSVIYDLECLYDTVGKGVKLQDHEGNRINVTGGTWGDLMNSKEEKEYIKERAENLQSELDRKPIMKQEASEISDRYILVSLEEQKLTFVDKGKVKIETSVVTGCTAKGNDTPTGVYFVSEKINGKYLTGPGYKTWVNKWMRLTNYGIGLHDAYWRGSFGGSIYRYNGSHGCVNIPKDVAYKLYDEINVGDIVIIY